MLATAHTQKALVALLRLTSSAGVPLHLLGLGSNVLYPDQGLGGVVARLGGVFSRTRMLGDRLRAGGAVPLPRLARSTASRGLLGLEAFSGFPSSVGGAVVMNAGCYGVEIKDVLISATALHRDGRRQRYRVGDLEASYRKTALQGAGVVVATATFQLRRGDATEALARIDELNRKRWASLPFGPAERGIDLPQPCGRPCRPADRGRRPQRPALAAERRSARSTPTSSSTSAARAPTTCSRSWSSPARRCAIAFGVELEPEIVLEGSLRERWGLGRPGERAAPP